VAVFFFLIGLFAKDYHQFSHSSEGYLIGVSYLLYPVGFVLIIVSVVLFTIGFYLKRTLLIDGFVLCFAI